MAFIKIAKGEKWVGKYKRALRLTMQLTRSTLVCRMVGVRYHCGGWSEEVNPCILISYMVYL